MNYVVELELNQNLREETSRCGAAGFEALFRLRVSIRALPPVGIETGSGAEMRGNCAVRRLSRGLVSSPPGGSGGEADAS